MRCSRPRFAIAFGLAAVAAGVAALVHVHAGFLIGACLAGVAWAGMLLDEVRGARAASNNVGRTPRGFTPGQVARAIAMSWLIPGLGQFYAGERVVGLLTSIVFLGGWVIANLDPAPSAVMVPAALALWGAGQVRVRRLLGVSWDPLIPSFGELFSRS